jgi:hypothetical protein
LHASAAHLLPSCFKAPAKEQGCTLLQRAFTQRPNPKYATTKRNRNYHLVIIFEPDIGTVNHPTQYIFRGTVGFESRLDCFLVVVAGERELDAIVLDACIVAAFAIAIDSEGWHA